MLPFLSNLQVKLPHLLLPPLLLLLLVKLLMT